MMRRWALLTLTFSAFSCLSLTEPAVAGQLSGLYLDSQVNAVMYLDIADANGQIGGSFVVVYRDRSQADGLVRRRFNVRGTSDGERAATEVFDGPNVTLSSVSFRMSLERTWSNLKTAISNSDGSLQEYNFTRSDVGTVNSAIAGLQNAASVDHQRYVTEQEAVARQQARQAAANDLKPAQQRLAMLRQQKSLALKDVADAQGALRDAIAELKAARSAYQDAKQTAEKALADASAAIDAAETTDEQAAAQKRESEAFHLQQIEFSSQSAVWTGEGRVDTATYHLQLAESAVSEVDEDLRRVSARIAQDRLVASQ